MLFDTPTTPTVPGLRHISGYLGVDRQQELLAIIDDQPWLTDLRRRVQHYGYRYDYRRRVIDRDSFLGPLPSWANDIVKQFHADDISTSAFNQLIVNEYLPGQGIAAHIDCQPCFANTILSLSLGSPCLFTMRSARHDHVVDVLLEPGDLLSMENEARYDWTHGIAARKSDSYAGQRFRRGRRVSLTFRTVIGDNDHS